MISVYLIKNAQTTWSKIGQCEGHIQTSLTKVGKAQSLRYSDYFINKNITSIYSSISKNAIQTAKIINKKLNIPFFRESLLKDQKKGKWEGKFQEEIETRYAEEYQIWISDPYGLNIDQFESLSSIQTRLETLITKLAIPQLFETNYLLVTHQNIIRQFLVQTSSSSYWEPELADGLIYKVELYPRLQMIEKIDIRETYA